MGIPKLLWRGERKIHDAKIATKTYIEHTFTGLRNMIMELIVE